MTHTDINKRIHKEIDGGCWHEESFYNSRKDEWVDDYDISLGSRYESTCKKCNYPDPCNLDYHTPEGTQKIKAWLIKEGKWEGNIKSFKFFLYEKKMIEVEEKGWAEGVIALDLIDIATDPEQFALKFYEYITREDK